MWRSLADWLGWERISETNRRHQRKEHEEIMAKIKDLEGTLTAVAAKTTKALGEIRGKIEGLNSAIDALRLQLEGADLPPGAAEKLAELESIATALGDIVPDVGA